MNININEPQESTATTFDVLPTDLYTMRIKSAEIEEDKFGQPRKDGTKPEKLVIVWEIKDLTDEQQEDGVREDALVWQRINPYYGTVKEGGPSKFKAFIDELIRSGALQTDEDGNFDTEDLVGIVQRVSVEKYTKTMGANAGQPGNRVTAVAPLRKPKLKGVQPVPAVAPVRPKPVEAIDDEDLPF